MKPKINRQSSDIIPMGYDQCGTPFWAVEPLFPYLEKFSVWEPAQGEGNLVKALENAGHYVFGTELDTNITSYVRKPDFTGVNFLTNTTILPPRIHEPYAIVTNPPYSGKLKQDFVERCYFYYEKYGIPFALLLPVELIGTGSAQELFDLHGGLQIMFLNTRVDFKMPGIGWSGKSTNKMKKDKKGKWVRQPGSQFPVAWYTVGLNLPKDIMFGKLKPYKMETLNDPYHWDSKENEIEQLELF